MASNLIKGSSLSTHGERKCTFTKKNPKKRRVPKRTKIGRLYTTFLTAPHLIQLLNEGLSLYF